MFFVADFQAKISMRQMLLAESCCDPRSTYPSRVLRPLFLTPFQGLKGS